MFEILFKDLTSSLPIFIDVFSYLYEFSTLISEVEHVKFDFGFLFILLLF